MIIILLLAILLVAAGLLLITKAKNVQLNNLNASENKVEFTEEIGTSLSSMGAVMAVSSIVKMSGGIGGGGFAFVFILNLICLIGLIYLIYKKHI